MASVVVLAFVFLVWLSSLLLLVLAVCICHVCLPSAKFELNCIIIRFPSLSAELGSSPHPHSSPVHPRSLKPPNPAPTDPSCEWTLNTKSPQARVQGPQLGVGKPRIIPAPLFRIEPADAGSLLLYRPDLASTAENRLRRWPSKQPVAGPASFWGLGCRVLNPRP